VGGVGRGGFICEGCGYRSGKWLGRCPECGAWSSLVERPAATRDRAPAPPAAVRSWSELERQEASRLATGLGELDRVLGGGLVPGAVVLVGGEPGIGKSTLLLEAAAGVATAGRAVLYISGEESAAQLAGRGDRLGLAAAGLSVAIDTDADAALEAAKRLAPELIVVDSVQAMRSTALESAPGSVAQVRETAARFTEYAKRTGTPTLLVGHVTKDGSIAGPRVLEHLVDAVLQFEGDRHHEHRLLRAHKNRFGPTDELGVFRMTEAGLVGVADPSGLLLAERPAGVPGSVVHAAIEGTRPLLVEVQALAGEPIQGSPRRTALGVDPARVALILAVLERRAGVPLVNRDVFVNVTGGLTLSETAADLTVATAVASSACGRAVPAGLVLAGEIGLTGEIRAVSRLASRLREAARLGFSSAVVPAAAAECEPIEGLRVLPARRLADALGLCLG
jgi:DNA repair protein RadA/Sms